MEGIIKIIVHLVSGEKIKIYCGSNYFNECIKLYEEGKGKFFMFGGHYINFDNVECFLFDE